MSSIPHPCGLPVSLRLVIGTAFVLAIANAAHGQTIKSQFIVGGLSQPVDLVAPPGDTSRVFLVLQTGQIRILTLATNALVAGNFIDFSAAGLNLTAANGEQGLLGLAFHPSYSSNGRFFVNYTRSSDGATVIAEYRASTPYSTSTTRDAGVAAITLRTISQPYANHNGGHLAFGPDGMLYIGMGDGGSSDDPGERAQDRSTLLGKMLRLDVNNPGGSYIPANNPYVGVETPTRLDEIWAFGLRNPWRFGFDRLTGDLWIADVGQDTREEVDFQPALTAGNLSQVSGRNYGWDCREGLIASPAGDDDCSLAGTYTDPIIDVPNGSGGSQTCSISGGYVYRGAAIPAIQGAYFYADYCADWIRSLRYNGTTVSDQRDWTAELSTPAGLIDSIVGFGEDGAGELYIISIGGSIYKIVSAECGCPCALAGNQAILFQDNFQTDTGWLVSLPGSGAATDGFWQRGVPVNDPVYPNDPDSDSDGSGSCYVTENSAPGSGTTSDVDGGSTLLTSPQMSWTQGAITICYDYFLDLSSAGASDGLFVSVSSNGTSGPFVSVASHTTDNGLRWTANVITQAQLSAAGITNTTNMRVRFTATDAGTDNIVEAGVDNFKVYTGNPFPDCNGNGVDDAIDISNGTSGDCNGNLKPDDCDIAQGLLADCDGGPVGVRSAGQTFFNNSCISCHGPNGTGGTGPDIRNKNRTEIRNRLKLIVPHPGGGFPLATDQDFANLEAFLADAGSRGRPDRIPDSCQTLADCDNDGASDGCELEHGTQIDADYNGIPDTCQCQPPTITQSPAAASVCDGATIMLSASASGTPVLSYQWRRGGLNLADGGGVSGATTASLTLSPITVAHRGAYDVVVSNACGSATSTAAVLTIGVRGDANCDGLVNNFDIDPFVATMLLPGAVFPPTAYLNVGGSAACWAVRVCYGDASCDALLNNFDIDPFIGCVVNPPAQPPCPCP